jgi:hypothetical protein
MEPEGSLPYSQEPATCPYPEPDKPNPHPLSVKTFKNFFVDTASIIISLTYIYISM